MLDRVSASPPEIADLQPLDPRVRTLWWISAGLGVLPVLLAATLLAVLVGGPARPLAGALVLLALVGAAAGPPLRYARWRYTVRPDDLWVRQGVLWITVTVVPFSRLQFVDTRQGPLDRAFGLASLVLHTAALGSQTTIPGLAAADAERLRERLADVDPDVVSV